MAAELFGLQVLGRVMGIVLTLDGVAEATSPMLVGYLRDMGGSYGTGFLSLIVAAVLGLWPSPSFLGEPRPSQEPTKKRG